MRGHRGHPALCMHQVVRAALRRADSGTTSFLVLTAIALAAMGVVAMAACGLLGAIAFRVASDGPGSLEADLWPAFAFLAVVAAGGAAGVRALRRAARSSMLLERRVAALAVPLPDAVAAVAAKARLGGRVRLLAADEPFSFTFGLWRPRVAVSRGLVHSVSPAELEAVLQHERHHVRSLDPLRVLAVRVLPAVLFYVPVLTALRARYEAGRELAADRRAVRRCGRRPLAGALLKVVRGPNWSELRMAAAIGGPELIDVRVRQLELGREPPLAWPGRGVIIVSLVAPLLLTAAFLLSAVQLGGPDAVLGGAGGRAGPLDLAMGIACAAPWLAGALVARAWLRGRRP